MSSRFYSGLATCSSGWRNPYKSLHQICLHGHHQRTKQIQAFLGCDWVCHCIVSVRQNKHFGGGNNFHCNSLMQMKSSLLAKDTRHSQCPPRILHACVHFETARSEGPLHLSSSEQSLDWMHGGRCCSEIETESQCNGAFRSATPLCPLPCRPS